MRFAQHTRLATLLTEAGIAARNCNGEPPCLQLPFEQWTTMAKLAKEAGLRLVAVWAAQEGEAFIIHAAFACKDHGYALAKTTLDTAPDEFPSITPYYVAAARMERVIHDLFGLIPDGHPDTRPWLKHEHWPANALADRVRFHRTERIRLAPGVARGAATAARRACRLVPSAAFAGILRADHPQPTTRKSKLWELQT